MYFSRTLNRFGEEIFSALNEKRVAREEKGLPCYNLSVGTPDFRTPPHIKQALIEAAGDQENWKYALRDLPELKQAVCAYYQKRFGVDGITPDMVASCNGTQEGMGHLAMCLADEGDTVILPTPCYPLDHDFAGEIGRQKEVLFDEVGLEIGGQMYPINDDGITLLTKAKFSVNRKVFGIPSYLQRLNDHEENRKAAKESLDRCRSEFELERALNPEGIQAIGESLERMRKLIAETAYGRFRYALFPGAVCSMRMDRKLKKVREDLDAYGLVDGLSYVTADINREMAYMHEDWRN